MAGADGVKDDSESWTVSKAADWVSGYFERRGIPDARLEAELFLSRAIGCSRLDLYLRKDEVVPAKGLEKLRRFVSERKRRVPLSYILGDHEFMGLKFMVNTSTLIPRPETELLVEQASKLIEERGLRTVVELGTGSGNIAVGLARFSGAERIFSSDASREALKVAQSNVCSNGAAGKVTLRHGDLFAAFEADGLEGKVDLVISNPPYIPESEQGELMPELSYEPRSALFGGGDGLEFYRRIVQGSSVFLSGKGCIAFELNAAKAPVIRRIVEDAGFGVIAVKKDYAGLERVLLGCRRGPGTSNTVRKGN